MAQDTEVGRLAPAGKSQSAPPGIGLTIAIAVISGVLCWFWLGAGSLQSPANNVSDLSEVQDDEVAGALATVTLPNDALAEFKQRTDGGCRRPIAWVSLASAPGEPPSHIRLISGTYYSPLFDVSATAVRVAIPFPARYETGHGVLTAINVGGSATVALFPAWRVSAQDGRTTREVSWRAMNNCAQR